MNEPPEQREISLADADNDRLANFAGPMEQNLRHVEDRLGVDVRRRGHRLQLSGPSGTLARAEAVLRHMFELSASEPMNSTPKAPKLLSNPLALQELKDWGLIPTMIDGESRTAGVLLNREADQSAECGFWTCTPGTWHCHVTKDEFCHFLAGRSTYTHGETGEVIEIRPDTVAFFPKDWKGTCVVHETVKKVYLIL